MNKVLRNLKLKIQIRHSLYELKDIIQRKYAQGYF